MRPLPIRRDRKDSTGSRPLRAVAAWKTRPSRRLAVSLYAGGALHPAATHCTGGTPLGGPLHPRCRSAARLSVQPSLVETRFGAEHCSVAHDLSDNDAHDHGLEFGPAERSPPGHLS